MNVVHLYLNDSLQQIIHVVVQEEGYTIASTPQASEAMRLIEGGLPCVLFVDNFTLNPEAIAVLTMLQSRPHVRRRTRIIGVTAAHRTTLEKWLADGLIDEHIPLPFDFFDLADRVKENAAMLAE